MTLRLRIAVTAAVAVALAFLVSAGGLYLTTARTLRGQLDRSLLQVAADLADGRPFRGGRALFGPRAGELSGPGGLIQVVDAEGTVVVAFPDTGRLPHGDDVAAVAAGEADAFFATLDVAGQPVRSLTVPVQGNLAAQVARPLTELEASLAALRARLAIGGVIGIALAAALGTVVARRAVKPVEQLTEVAEEVAATGDLSRRIAQPARQGDAQQDELDRLAHTFNAMLANLEQARTAQQQLVADASHELRTPLTSLRTNIQVLALDAAEAGQAAQDGAETKLTAQDRRRLLADLNVQLEEFGRLVAALVELARGAQPARATTLVRLDELVEAATDRARAFAGDGQQLTVQVQRVVVRGESDRLERAVANLLDNAIKYGGGEPIEVVVERNGSPNAPRARVQVRDHGPGIDRRHLPHVFERFYRAPDARKAPGSGLGLAIVQQVAEAHGGTARVANASGAGAVVTLELPLAEQVATT